MTEVTVHQPPVGEQIELVKTLSPSALLPESFRNNPANLMYAVQYANALGLAPIHAITGIAVIKGKPTASADLMAAIVRRAGHKLRVTGDDTYAEAVLIRKDDPTFEYKTRWDREKAHKAGLTNNPTYSKYPGAMYRARAVSEVVRMGASDAMYGLIYAPEDFGEVANEPTAAPEAETGPTTKVSRKAKAPTPAEAEDGGDSPDTPTPPPIPAFESLDEARDYYTHRQKAGASPDELQAIIAAAPPADTTPTNKETA